MCTNYDSTIVSLFYYFASWSFETQTASRLLLCGHSRRVFGEHMCTSAWWVHVHASACVQAVALCTDSAYLSKWMRLCSIPGSDETSCCSSHGFFKFLEGIVFLASGHLYTFHSGSLNYSTCVSFPNPSFLSSLPHIPAASPLFRP